MCAMELSNGTTIEVTPEHRFFNNGEWTPIEELNVNDTLQLKDNSIVVIENKIIFPTFVEVYNLEIEDNENYYVTEEGVLVHNGCKRGIEVKSGKYFSSDKNIAYEVERDAALVQDGWSIEWHIDGKASQPLLDALKEAGITKTP